MSNTRKVLIRDIDFHILKINSYVIFKFMLPWQHNQSSVSKFTLKTSFSFNLSTFSKVLIIHIRF